MKKLNPISLALVLFCSMGLKVTWAQTLPTAGAYVTDEQTEYVQDQVTESITTANQIFCFMANTRPDLMVNAGRYMAWIDEEKCDQAGRGGGDKSAQSGGGSATQYTKMLISTQRNDTTSPQTMKGHVELVDDFGTIGIYLNGKMSAEPSDTSPNGTVEMNFTGVASGNVQFRGAITAEGTTMTFAESGNMGSGDYSVQLYVAGNSTTGTGAIKIRDPGSRGNKDVVFGFNADSFCRNDTPADDTKKQCFSRKKSDASSTTWRYGVYDDSTGARYDIAQPGFQVKKGNDWGWAGYWGVWFRNGISDGDTLAGSDGTAYTVKKTGGRLYKYTKTATTFNDIQKVPFEFFVNNAGAHAKLVANKQTQAFWNGTAFILTAYVNCGASGCKLKKMTGNEASRTITPANLNTATGGFGLNGWSQALGGNINVPSSVLTGGSTGTATINYTKQSTVQPGDATIPATLVCLRDCPAASRLANAASASVFTTGTANKHGGTALGDIVTYTWDTNAYELKDGGTALVNSSLPSKSDLNGTQYNWGFRTGPMVVNTKAGSGQALDCDAGGGGTNQCAHLAERESEFYIWEMGRQEWHSSVFLQKADNSFVVFTPPQSAAFTVPANQSGKQIPYGEFAGAKMSLIFEGFGELHGIPGKCFSPKSNKEISCDDNSEGGWPRYVPAFSIPYAPTTDAGNKVTIGGDTKWVKWLERELRFLADDTLTTNERASTTITLGDINSASMPAAFSATGGDAKDPYVAANGSTVYAGDYPAASVWQTTPSIIHGVKQ